MTKSRHMIFRPKSQPFDYPAFRESNIEPIQLYHDRIHTCLLRHVRHGDPIDLTHLLPGNPRRDTAAFTRLLVERFRAADVFFFMDLKRDVGAPIAARVEGD